MKKTTHTQLGFHFIFIYLSMLLDAFRPIITQDEILYNSLLTAFNRANDIISVCSFGNIADQYVVTVYEDDE